MRTENIISIWVIFGFILSFLALFSFIATIPMQVIVGAGFLFLGCSICMAGAAIQDAISEK